MTRSEMLKRLDAGEAPLEVSIQKWEDIARDTVMGGILRDGSCALCETYLGCVGCPVKAKTREILCFGSPYRKLFGHISQEHVFDITYCRVCLEIVKEEIEFLKGLRT